MWFVGRGTSEPVTMVARTRGEETRSFMEKQAEARVMESPLGQALRLLAALQERQTAALFELAQRQVKDWALLRSMLQRNPAGQLPPTTPTGRYARLQMP